MSHEVSKKTWIAKRSVINTGIWVEEGDDSATLGKPFIFGVCANDYHEGAVLVVTCRVYDAAKEKSEPPAPEDVDDALARGGVGQR